MISGYLDFLAGRPASLLAELQGGQRLGRLCLRLSLTMTICAGLYGAAFGSWHGPRLAFFVAVKFPLVLLATSALTLPFARVASMLVGAPLRFVQVAVLTFLVLGAGSLLLASVTPVVWLFTNAAPPPSPTTRTAHNLLYLMHTLLVGCGIGGVAILGRTLALLDVPPRSIRQLGGLWVGSFALVGGEVAWALRPFVGSVYYPVAFLRPDALDGNVYEFVFTDILPHLLGQPAGGSK